MDQLIARYHPLLVTLHWLIAVLILAALAVGFFVLDDMPNSDPRKITVLMIHMAAGILILALMIIRFVVRLMTAKPPAATTGSRSLDRFAPLTHYGFYVLVVLIAGSGMATALMARLNEIVFAGSGEPLPASFDAFAPFRAHGFLALVLVAFIALHLAAAIYHHFVRRDGLLRRMWFGAGRSG
jgi:cytochrome b561